MYLLGVVIIAMLYTVPPIRDDSLGGWRFTEQLGVAMAMGRKHALKRGENKTNSMIKQSANSLIPDVEEVEWSDGDDE